MNSVYASLPTTVFERMNLIARETGALNLGQGFPEEDGPLDIREAAARAILESSNQYPPMRGTMQLREAVAEHYTRLHGIALDASEVTVTSGATEAIAAAILAVVEPGDEVIVFEPVYDAYIPLIQRAGGVPKIVRLSPPFWRMEEEKLAAAFGPMTKAVVLNTPLNPTASVIPAEDLALLARFCVQHDCVAISDEVWEHVLFDGGRHASMLAAPGMRERTIKIGSAGKMFSLTGWKVGFACAAPALTDVFAKAHQFLTFTTAPHLQAAVAYGLAKPRQHFEAMAADFQRSRDRLSSALHGEGFAILPTPATYFLTVDLRASGLDCTDETFAEHAARQAGIVAIPYAAFYANPPDQALVRLCFAKSDANLDEGAARMGRARTLPMQPSR